MEKMAWDGPKWGREDFFPANPGLANILGRTDLDFEDLYFFHFLDPQILDFQVPRFPKSGLGPGGPLGWAGLGPWAGWAPRVGRVGARGLFALQLGCLPSSRVVCPPKAILQRANNLDFGPP